MGPRSRCEVLNETRAGMFVGCHGDRLLKSGINNSYCRHNAVWFRWFLWRKNMSAPFLQSCGATGKNSIINVARFVWFLCLGAPRTSRVLDRKCAGGGGGGPEGKSVNNEFKVD
jgi:hypothetical protein